MQLSINLDGTNILVVNVDDSSYLNKQLGGDHNVFLKFTTDTYTEIPLGATIALSTADGFIPNTYRLCVPAKITKISSHQFDIEATFESDQYSLKKYTMRELRYNENTSAWEDTGNLQFPLTATPLEHLQMIVANLNQREGASVWSVGSCITANAKLINYDYTYLWDALQNLAQEFETEFEIVSHTINLKKVEYHKSAAEAISLSYGKGNGFKSGVGRVNYGDTMPIEVLNVQGSDRNIDFSKYGSKRLRLPGMESFQYDDEGCFKFSGESNWWKWDEEDREWDVLSSHTPVNAQSYATDSNGISVYMSSGRKTNNEGNFDATEFYPSRICKVTSVIFSQDAQPLCDIVDNTIPQSLNFANYVIAGETPTIVFQSGMLAGREFSYDAESGYVHADRKFLIKNEEIDGQIMPEPTTWKPAVGDEFVVFGIQLPDDYLANRTTKTGASYDMLRAAVAYLHENKNSKYTFSGELDGIYAKTNWNSIGYRLAIGEFVNFTDSNFQSTSVLIRIVGVKQYLTNPYSPEIEMSNESIGSTLISEMRKAQAQEVTTEVLHEKAIQYAKRGFTDAKQTSEALEKMIEEVGTDFSNFSGGISPITVNTMQLLVGSENLQFAFGTVSSATFTKQTLNAGYDTTSNTFKINFSTTSYLLHYTIGQPKTMTTSAIGDKKVWKMKNFESGSLAGLSDKVYNVYAKVKRSDSGTVSSLPSSATNNTFVLSETAIGMESDSSYYYFLVGILNSEVDGDRSFAEMFGFSEILPNRITTDKIMSSDGQGVVIDLVNGTITGRIRFLSNNTPVDADQYISQEVNSEISGLGIAGTNLLPMYNFWEQGTTSNESDPSYTYEQMKIASDTRIRTQSNINLESGEQYTLHCEGVGFTFGIVKLNNGYGAGWGGWQTSAYTFTASGFNSVAVIVAKTNGSAMTPDEIGNVKIKLERGSTATEWTLAPEDVSAGISAIDNLEIGGRNLLLKSADEWVNAATTAAWKRLNISITPLETDGDYIISFDAKTSNGTDVLYVALGVDDTSRIIERGIMPTTSYARYVVSLKNSGAYATSINSVLCSNHKNYQSQSSNNGTLYIKNFKLEKGNKPTDWTPAPEDPTYEDLVKNLHATCETASATQTKVIVCPDLTPKMLTDSNLRIKIKFTNASSTSGSLNTKLVFNFRNTAGGSNITPEGASYADVRVWYRNAEAEVTQVPSGGVQTMPFWNDGQEVEFTYKNINSGYSRLQFVDEEGFDTTSALFKAYKGETEIMGGLILTETVIAGKGYNQAGMNGSDANNVAFWAGGTIGNAQRFNTPVVILRNGDAKLGYLRFDSGGTIFMDDSEDLSRLIITRETVSNYETSASNSVSKCPSNATQGGSEVYTVSTQTVSVDSNGTYTVFEVNRALGTTIEKKHNGMLVVVSGTVTIQRTYTGNNPMYDLRVKCQDRTTSVLSRSFLIGESSYQATINVEATYWANSTNAGTVDFKLVVTGFTGSQSDSVQISGLKVRWYHDVSVAKTVIASDGFAAIINTSNFFRSIEKTVSGSKVLETTIKGDVNMPGVLWAGEITSGGGGYTSPSFKNSAVTLTNNGTVVTDTSLYNFKYTGISGTPIIIATPKITTADGYGWSAMVESLSTTNKTFSVRVKRDNSKVAGAFNLVVFGTT